MTSQNELIKLAKSGDMEASEKLVAENAGLIWSVAKRFIGRGAEPDGGDSFRYSGLVYCDLHI